MLGKTQSEENQQLATCKEIHSTVSQKLELSQLSLWAIQQAAVLDLDEAVLVENIAITLTSLETKEKIERMKERKKEKNAYNADGFIIWIICNFILTTMTRLQKFQLKSFNYAKSIFMQRLTFKLLCVAARDSKAADQR